MPGPGRKATALKVLSGNPGKRPLPVNEPKPQTDLSTTAPAWLDRSAKVEWKKVRGWMHGEVIKDCDQAVAALYCQAMSDVKRLTRLIRKEGEVVVYDSGAVARNPLSICLREAKETLLKCAMQMGLTPSSRTRISIPKGKESKNEFW